MFFTTLFNECDCETSINITGFNEIGLSLILARSDVK